MIAPIRTIATVYDAAPANAAADEAPLLRVFWHLARLAEIDDQTEPLPHALAELVGTAHRLDVALAELRALAGVRDVTRARSTASSSDWRTSPADSASCANGCCACRRKAARYPGPHLAPALHGNGESSSAAPSADLVAPVERILALIDDDLRRYAIPQARRTFLHLSLCIAGALHDPGETGASLHARPDERRRLNRRLRRELRDIVARLRRARRPHRRAGRRRARPSRRGIAMALTRVAAARRRGTDRRSRATTSAACTAPSPRDAWHRADATPFRSPSSASTPGAGAACIRSSSPACVATRASRRRRGLVLAERSRRRPTGSAAAEAAQLGPHTRDTRSR